MRLIDADEAYKALTDYYQHRTDIQHKALKEALERVPTVDAEPVRHGRWAEQDHTDWEYSKEYRCSECGMYRLVTVPHGWNWNYCPNCGAKMGERRADETN